MRGARPAGFVRAPRGVSRARRRLPGARPPVGDARAVSARACDLEAKFGPDNPQTAFEVASLADVELDPQARRRGGLAVHAGARDQPAFAWRRQLGDRDHVRGAWPRAAESRPVRAGRVAADRRARRAREAVGAGSGRDGARLRPARAPRRDARAAARGQWTRRCARKPSPAGNFTSSPRTRRARSAARDECRLLDAPAHAGHGVGLDRGSSRPIGARCGTP